MGNDLADAVSLVATRVITVAMRVEEHRNALARALLQARHANLGGVHELAVDGNRAATGC